MLIEELDLEVLDVDDFNDTAVSILEDYCTELEKDPAMTRPIRGEDLADCEFILFMWTDKARDLILEEMARLRGIGIKHFGEDADIDLSTGMYQEI